MTAPRFRLDNTDGYNATELAELNQRFDRVLNHAIGDRPVVGITEMEFKSLSDHVAERVLTAFDVERAANA